MSSLPEEMILQKCFQEKSLEVANNYNKQSILAITNLVGDFITFFTVYLLFAIMKPQIIIHLNCLIFPKYLFYSRMKT